MNKKKLQLAVIALSALFIILVGTIAVLRTGNTQAALTASEEQTLEIEMKELHVELYENHEAASTLFSAWAEESLDPGKPYEDVITVSNNGDYDEYVRVVVKKYWKDSSGKRVDLSPSFINLVPDSGSNWTENTKERTQEQSVWYYNESLPVGTESEALFTSFYISNEVFTNVGRSVTTSTTDNVTTITFDYDEITFVVEAEVHAIQYNSADKAILSAWGVTNVTAADGNVTVSN